MKKALTYEWITIHTKRGTTYERRQRKKVKETTNTPANNKAERLKEWKNKDSLAGLKDALAVSLKYNRNYYDSRGNAIYIPTEYQDIIEEIHHSKNNDSTFTNFLTGNESDIEKQKKTKLIGLIKLKDKLFAQELTKKKQFHDESVNNPEHIKTNINNFLGAINEKRSSVNDILWVLGYIRKMIDGNIDPTIELTFDGKVQKKTLSEILLRLEKAKESDASKARANTGISNITVSDLDDYDGEDFTNHDFVMTQNTHNDIVNKVNKKLEKMKKG